MVWPMTSMNFEWWKISSRTYLKVSSARCRPFYSGLKFVSVHEEIKPCIPWPLVLCPHCKESPQCGKVLPFISSLQVHVDGLIKKCVTPLLTHWSYVFLAWINHLPPECWSTFWKSIFKHQLGCRFDILDSISSFFFVFWHMQLYICLDTWYHFLALSLLLEYFFFSSTPVLTSSIEVVFVLSIDPSM